MQKRILVLALTLIAASGFQAFAQTFTYGTADDKDKGGTSVIKLVTAKETIGGKEYDVNTVTGSVTTKFQYGFVVFLAVPDDQMMTVLKTATGIKFKTSGDGQKYQVRVETSDITDFDFYGKVFVAPKGNPVDMIIPYAKLSQLGWGAKKTFNPANIKQITVQTVGQPIAAISYKFFDLQPIK